MNARVEDVPAYPKVLVIDNDPHMQSCLSRILRDGSFDPVAVASAAEMRAVLEAEDCALVLLDVLMPGEDGWAALRWLRARSDVPVIMLSALADTDHKVSAFDLGADDYVAKPFSNGELLARVHGVLRRAARREEQRSTPADASADASTGAERPAPR